MLGSLLLGFFVSVAPPGWACPGALSADVQEWIQQLHDERDLTPEEVLQALVDEGTRESFDGLSAGYDRLDSIFARRRVLELLPGYEGAVDVEQIALEKLMNVATSAKEPELRETAITSIARFDRLGKGFLRLIVDSLAVGSSRVQAMEEHTARADSEDLEWYEELFGRTPELVTEQVEAAQKEARMKRLEQPELPPRFHAEIRRMAFSQLVGEMSSKDLFELARGDFDSEVRRMALTALGQTGDRTAKKAAIDRFKRVDERPKVRRKAAEVLADIEGDGVVKDFLDMAGKSTTPDLLRKSMAQLSARFAGESEKVAKLLVKRLGKGKYPEQRFVFLATRALEDEKVTKALRKALVNDKEPGLQSMAMGILAERGDMESEAVLRQMMVDEESPVNRQVAAFRSLAVLLKGQPEWRDELLQFAEDENRTIRNTALSELGQGEFDTLLAALDHEDWSTRLVVIHRFTALRTKPATQALVTRLDQETGRMQRELVDALWELTGQAFGMRISAWKSWWASEGADAELPSLAKIEELKAEREELRLKQMTSVETPQFFGVRLATERVVFVLDVSGSMAWEVGGQGSNRGESVRLDIAKKELLKTLESLRPEVLFNLIMFSSGVSSWADGGIFASSEKTRAEAVEFVERIGAGGGTNIYAAMRAAFADPEADTIVLLSDGEPSMGRLTDSLVLRDEIARWNENRNIVIHTIAVGTQLDLLEWLAEDSGGRHVRYE